MIPLMPSPGRPKTTVTPQSIRRSATTSAAVRSMFEISEREELQGERHLLLPLENPGDAADEFFPERPMSPFIERDFAGVRAVAFEIHGEACGDMLVAECDVYLVVVFERAVVQVGRADHRPEVVDEQRLDVRHAALVFEHLDAALEDAAVHATARQPHPPLIGVASRH